MDTETTARLYLELAHLLPHTRNFREVKIRGLAAQMAVTFKKEDLSEDDLAWLKQTTEEILKLCLIDWED